MRRQPRFRRRRRPDLRDVHRSPRQRRQHQPLREGPVARQPDELRFRDRRHLGVGGLLCLGLGVHSGVRVIGNRLKAIKVVAVIDGWWWWWWLVIWESFAGWLESSQVSSVVVIGVDIRGRLLGAGDNDDDNGPPTYILEIIGGSWKFVGECNARRSM